MSGIEETRRHAERYFADVALATGDTYRNARGWNLRLRMKTHQGEEMSVSRRVRVETKREARMELREWVDTVALPELIRKARRAGVATGSNSLSYWARQDIGARSMKPNSRKTVLSALEAYIESHEIGQREIAALRPKHIEEFLRDLTTARGPASQSTQRKVFGIINRACKRALRDEEIFSNPCDGVIAAYYLDRDARPDEKPAMELSDHRKLVAEAQRSGDRHMEMMLRVAGGSGVRLGELVALRWEDFRDDGLWVARAARKDEKGQWVTSGGSGREVAKSEAGERYIPLQAELLHEMAFYRIECGSPGDDEWVFPNADGGMMASTTMGTRLKALGARAGLCKRIQRCPETGKKTSRYIPLGGRTHAPGWHQLRRMFASHMAEDPTITPQMLKTIMGWQSIEMANRYYRTTPQSIEKTREAVARFTDQLA